MGYLARELRKISSIDRMMSHDIVLLFNNPESFLF